MYKMKLWQIISKMKWIEKSHVYKEKTTAMTTTTRTEKKIKENEFETSNQVDRKCEITHTMAQLFVHTKWVIILPSYILHTDEKKPQT